MPQIEAAKAQGKEAYSACLMSLGVTPEQVRQWRRRLKKAGEVVTLKSIPHPYADGKPTNQDKFRAQQSVTPKVKKISADATSLAINAAVPEIGYDHYGHGKSDFSHILIVTSDFNKLIEISAKFEDAVTQHQEWYPSRIKAVRRKSAETHDTFERNMKANAERVTPKSAALPAQPTKRETAALVAIVEKANAMYRLFDVGELSAAEWREDVNELEEEYTTKPVAQKRPWLFQRKFKEIRTRMNVAIRDHEAAYPAVKVATKPQEPKDVTTVKKPLHVVINNVQVAAEKGIVFFNLEQESQLVYHGKRRHGWMDTTSEQPDKNGVAKWRHTIWDITGVMHTEVYIEGADVETVTETLLAKWRDMLTKLNMWRDKLEKEYRAFVKEHLEWEAQKKQERSERAKHAAAKRALQAAVNKSSIPA